MSTTRSMRALNCNACSSTICQRLPVGKLLSQQTASRKEPGRSPVPLKRTCDGYQQNSDGKACSP
eukprot:7131651-Pyramimonas_sp.AAC.1